MLNNILILFCFCVVSSVCQESIVCSEKIPYIKTLYNSRGEVKSVLSVKTLKTCCEGYMRVKLGHGMENFLCDPICQPRCSQKQFCEKPGVCACFPGYTVKYNHTGNEEICQPICSDCEQTYCIAPYTCRYPTTAEDRSFTRRLPAARRRLWNTDMYPNSTASESNNEQDINADILLNKMRNQTSTTKTSTESTTPSNRSVSSTDKPNLNHTGSTNEKEDIYYFKLLIKMRNQTATTKTSTEQRTSSNTSVGDADKDLNHTGYLRTPNVSVQIFRSVTVKRTTTSATTDSHLINKTYKEHNGNTTLRPLETKNISGVNNTNESKEEMERRSWVEENGISMLLPVIAILTAVLVLILLILWHRTPIMVYLRARYYVADDHLPSTNGSQKVAYSNNNGVKMLKKTALQTD